MDKSYSSFGLFLLQYIMEDIFWSGTPLLESVGEHEPAVEELRETIRRAIRRSLIPLKEYARQFDKYLELINMDISQYIKLVSTFYLLDLIKTSLH